MIPIKINDIKILVKSNISVLEACKLLGVIIPRFCFHETLSISGNCRMCLVEILNSKGPVASCALLVSSGLEIFTNTPFVQKARENIVELLLINHPLDCPICDQGGECDLQDQSKSYGSGYSRYFFKKRGVEQKSFNPLIKAVMTRCIHCTRCVRYNNEISSNEIFGTLTRGTSTEIGNYSIDSYNSEISGNIIDLCPVGALTAKSYMFKARPWELKVIESIDTTDGFGSNILINIKDNRIVRIIPKNNKYLNDNIISDKIRFSYDSLLFNRIGKIFKKHSLNFNEIYSWDYVLNNYLKKPIKSLLLVDGETDFETLYYLKYLNYKKPSFYKVRFLGFKLNINFLSTNYTASLTNALSTCSSAVCFLFGTNIQLESTILNTKLRNKFLNDNLLVFNFSNFYKANFNIQFINISILFILQILESRNKNFSTFLIKLKNPIFCYKKDFNINFNILINFIPSLLFIKIESLCNLNSLKLLNIPNLNGFDYKLTKRLWIINTQETYFLYRYLKENNHIKDIYWFTNIGSKLISIKSSLILPILSEFEESNIYLNFEFRPQQTNKAITNKGNSRSLKLLIKLLCEFVSVKVKNYNYIEEILNYSLKFLQIKNFFSKNFNFIFLKKINLYPIKINYEYYTNSKFTNNSSLMVKSSKNVRKLTINFDLK